MTTIAGSIAAYGLIDRRKYLISSYAAMQTGLEGIKALGRSEPGDCVEETLADVKRSGLVAPIVGRVGDGNFPREPARRHEQPT